MVASDYDDEPYEQEDFHYLEDEDYDDFVNRELGGGGSGGGPQVGLIIAALVVILLVVALLMAR